MKTLITILFTMISAYPADAQTSKYSFKVVPIFTRQTFFLNGGANAVFGTGKSREVLQIDLPSNTVEWYYSVTTSSDKNQTKENNLSAQLVKYLIPDAGIKETNISALISPTGSGACDVLMMIFPSEVTKFLASQPFVGADIRDSRKNYISGVVQVSDYISGTCYLAIKNPSATQEITITIDVAAIVKDSAEAASTVKQ
jgi:hypothetical protein